ncbi:amidohydrolase [Sporosarcina sp. P26b]|uniref:amidohydrolase n=1 Tax=Sporosarcina TaxID=1569 RepID=UPI000A17BF42|nr:MULTISPECIES: amidohydrolase [Sporosarcina]ARK22014.1 peptidase M20 [Sporosarcina ureae]PIC96327.1 amidohydrolase [Sporosarcina sp. P26b]
MITSTNVNEYVKNKARELEPETIKVRTYLYERPELSSKEYETSKFLKEEITKLGLVIEDVPGSTGFTALLDTGREGKTLGIRADIDALPVTENPMNMAGPRKYFSKNENVMHACGHDGHMSIVLSTIKILESMKDSLSGKIYFIFEEGEEIGSGIDAMIKHLEGRGIEAIYGNHLASFMDSGTLCVDEGPRMAGAILVDFAVHGKSGHGSRPDLSINPLFAAANILVGLTNAWANQIDVTKTVTLGLTQIHGGTALNIIPEKIDIGGSLRFYDMDEGRKALELMKKVIDLTAQAHNCRVEFKEIFKIASDPVMNDKQLAELAQNGFEEILPGSVVHDIKWFASESFNKYSKISPIVFVFVGVRDEEYGSGAEHHNDQFDIDENALVNGVMATTKFAVDFLMK